MIHDQMFYAVLFNIITNTLFFTLGILAHKFREEEKK